MKSWPTGSVEERVVWAIEEIRPAIRADGGDIHLVGIEGTTVFVELSGACRHCPMASSTLSDLVLDRILLYAPEVEKLERVNLPSRGRPFCCTPDTNP